MKLEHDPDRTEIADEVTVIDTEVRAAHALRNILTIASFHEPEDDPRVTLSAIRSIARRALFSKS